MFYSAKVKNELGEHHVTLRTGDKEHSIDISPQASGFGSSANGGELLFLALATCYCNDIYREATKLGLAIQGVEVEVYGDFERAGEPASNIRYKARVTSSSPEEDVRSLMEMVDQIAEIQQTVRIQTPIKLEVMEVISPSHP